MGVGGNNKAIYTQNTYNPREQTSIIKHKKTKREKREREREVGKHKYGMRVE